MNCKEIYNLMLLEVLSAASWWRTPNCLCPVWVQLNPAWHCVSKARILLFGLAINHRLFWIALCAACLINNSLRLLSLDGAHASVCQCRDKAMLFKDLPKECFARVAIKSNMAGHCAAHTHVHSCGCIALVVFGKCPPIDNYLPLIAFVHWPTGQSQWNRWCSQSAPPEMISTYRIVKAITSGC